MEWRQLENLLNTVTERGIERLAPAQILEFGRLYRQAAAELSFQRMRDADREQLQYLNDLVGRCYPYVYTAPRRPWPSARHFFLTDFPQAFRRHLLWILLAFLVSIIPACIGFAITRHDRAVAGQVLNRNLLESSERVAERHHTKQDWLPAEERSAAASEIMTNNIRVTIMAFAGGMTVGIVTLAVMIFNGFMLGIVAAVVGSDGAATAINFWAFVAPHGVFELTAIFISGGAGLILAAAILNPGTLPRRIALREAGKEALKLILGVAALLVVAGLIEGFFSPMNIDERIKYAVAGVEAVVLFGYLFLAGRGSSTTVTVSGALMTPIPSTARHGQQIREVYRSW